MNQVGRIVNLGPSSALGQVLAAHNAPSRIEQQLLELARRIAALEADMARLRHANPA